MRQCGCSWRSRDCTVCAWLVTTLITWLDVYPAPAMQASFQNRRARSKPHGVDLHVETETALATSTGEQADSIGNQPRVAEVVDEAIRLLVEAVAARVVVEPRDSFEHLVDSKTAVDEIVLDFLAKEVVGETQ